MASNPPSYRFIPHTEKPYDDTMFRTVDIFVGQTLRFRGWSDFGSLFKVVRILTDPGPGKAMVLVERCEHNSDTVVIESVSHPEMGRRQSRFDYLQGASRWMIAPGYTGKFPEQQRGGYVVKEKERTTHKPAKRAAASSRQMKKTRR